MAAAPSLTPDALPAVIVPGLRTNGLSLASASSVVSGRGCSSLSTVDRPGLAARHLDRHDLLGEDSPTRMRLAGALLRAEREGVLVVARDLVVLGDVLAGLRHRIDAVLLLHQRIDEAPADGGVLDLGRCAENASGALPMTNGARVIDSTPPAMAKSISPARIARAAVADRVEAGRAQPVDGDAGHAIRQARQQQRHARDVAVVLAGLVGAAEDDLVERAPSRRSDCA